MRSWLLSQALQLYQLSSVSILYPLSLLRPGRYNPQRKKLVSGRKCGAGSKVPGKPGLIGDSVREVSVASVKDRKTSQVLQDLDLAQSKISRLGSEPGAASRLVHSP